MDIKWKNPDPACWRGDQPVHFVAPGGPLTVTAPRDRWVVLTLADDSTVRVGPGESWTETGAVVVRAEVEAPPLVAGLIIPADRAVEALAAGFGVIAWWGSAGEKAQGDPKWFQVVEIEDVGTAR
jgi:hypothetical protein